MEQKQPQHPLLIDLELEEMERMVINFYRDEVPEWMITWLQQARKKSPEQLEQLAELWTMVDQVCRMQAPRIKMIKKLHTAYLIDEMMKS